VLESVDRIAPIRDAMRNVLLERDQATRAGIRRSAALSASSPTFRDEVDAIIDAVGV
jgi:hypothetical protein